MEQIPSRRYLLPDIIRNQDNRTPAIRQAVESGLSADFQANPTGIAECKNKQKKTAPRVISIGLQLSASQIETVSTAKMNASQKRNTPAQAIPHRLHATTISMPPDLPFQR
ncbi:MAG TPA: hypothetical protein DFL85_07425 [Lentisphaeria bacterium]|nr:hypothetical protein C5Q97_02495 [Victivallales bacterium CCUG 44730]HBP06183.1 hypothetical protein [Lentisphaeria bacterium]HCH85326.1 hypothetical protein [Lentisphaeria bacterium]